MDSLPTWSPHIQKYFGLSRGHYTITQKMFEGIKSGKFQNFKIAQTLAISGPY